MNSVIGFKRRGEEIKKAAASRPLHYKGSTKAVCRTVIVQLIFQQNYVSILLSCNKPSSGTVRERSIVRFPRADLIGDVYRAPGIR